MLDIQTLLISSMIARASFGLIFLLACFRWGAVVAFRFWTLSIASSALGIWINYTDPSYPYFEANTGAVIYLVVGLSIVSLWAGTQSFFGRPIDKVRFVTAWLTPGCLYWLLATLEFAGPVVLFFTIGALIRPIVMTLRSVLTRQGMSYLPSQLLVATAVATFTLWVTATVFLLAIGVMIQTGSVRPEAFVTSLSLILEQAVSVLIYVGMLAMTLEDAQRKMTKAATTDPLTELANRRGLEERARALIGSGVRLKRPMALMIADIDHFKSINDRYGHASGDLVLKQFADRLRATFQRKQDVVARWGGEEFVAIVYDMPLAEAIALAERLCRSIAKSPFDIAGEMIVVTVSIGVAPFEHEEPHLERAAQRADAALYDAKRTGRNRVCTKAY